MSDKNELYQQLILDHNKNPRNFRRLKDATHTCCGTNPLCGDELVVDIKLGADKRVEEISFEGTGCAISKASASIMTDSFTGKTEEEARALVSEFVNLVKGESGPDGTPHLAPKLKVFKGVREFPSRVKCASLAWHTLESALDNMN
ncbi:MAG: Fe-S cluster assembly sulfur transfer protein SufU, partial [Nitrospinota bacterium]